MTSPRSSHFVDATRCGGHRTVFFKATILTLSCLLALLGVTVPNLTKPASPKPRPRAVVETAGKSSQEAAKRVAVMEADLSSRWSQPIPPAPRRTFFAAVFVADQVGGVLLPASRAPPLRFS